MKFIEIGTARRQRHDDRIPSAFGPVVCEVDCDAFGAAITQRMDEQKEFQRALAETKNVSRLPLTPTATSNFLTLHPRRPFQLGVRVSKKKCREVFRPRKGIQCAPRRTASQQSTIEPKYIQVVDMTSPFNPNLGVIPKFPTTLMMRLMPAITAIAR
jgi:hypothetical protein